MWSFNTIVMNCIKRRIAFFTVLLILAWPGSYLLGYVHNHFSLFGLNEALIEEYYYIDDYWELYYNTSIANLLDIEDTGVKKKYYPVGRLLVNSLEILTTLDSRFNHAELAASKPRRCAQVRKTLSFYHQYDNRPGATDIPIINGSITIHIGLILPDLEQYLQEHCLDPFFDSAGEESKGREWTS